MVHVESHGNVLAAVRLSARHWPPMNSRVTRRSRSALSARDHGARDKAAGFRDRGVRSALKAPASRIRARRGAVILLYHRVAEPDLDPWGLAVSPKHFEEHLEVLGARGPSLTLSALLESREPVNHTAARQSSLSRDGYCRQSVSWQCRCWSGMIREARYSSRPLRS